MSDIIEEFMILLMGTNHKLTLSYSKEEKAMEENANKRIQEYLRDIMFERRIIKKNWSLAQPFVQKVTPAELLYGNAIDLDKGIFLPNAPLDAEGREVRLSEWAANMLQMQKDILEVATKLQKKRDLRRLIEKHTFEMNKPFETACSF